MNDFGSLKGQSNYCNFESSGIVRGTNTEQLNFGGISQHESYPLGCFDDDGTPPNYSFTETDKSTNSNIAAHCQTKTANTVLTGVDDAGKTGDSNLKSRRSESNETRQKVESWSAEISRLLNLENPMASQWISSYGFGESEEWKMEIWNLVIRNVVLIRRNDFLLTVSQIVNAVNEVVRTRRSLLAFSTSSLGSVVRGLVNKNLLLVLSSCQRHLDNSLWELTPPAVDQCKPQEGIYKTLCGRQTTTVKFDMSSGKEVQDDTPRWGVSRPINMFIRSLYNFVKSQSKAILGMESFSSLDEDFNNDSYDDTGVAVCAREFSIPYSETLSVDDEVDTPYIYLPEVERLAGLFASETLHSLEVQRSAEPSLFADCGGSDADDFSVGMHTIRIFLEKHMQCVVTDLHMDIFLWYTTYFAGISKPFICPIYPNVEKTGGQKNLEKNTCIRFVKLSPSNPRLARTVNVWSADVACALEWYVTQLLNRRLKAHAARIDDADAQCRMFLRQENRTAASLWLRRKKTMESGVIEITNQIMRIEEARQLRGSSAAIGVVSHVLSTTLEATRQTLGPGEVQSVTSVLDDLQETAQDVQDVRQAFEASAVRLENESAEGLIESELAALAEEISKSTGEEISKSTGEEISKPAVEGMALETGQGQSSATEFGSKVFIQSSALTTKPQPYSVAPTKIPSRPLGKNGNIAGYRQDSQLPA